MPTREQIEIRRRFEEGSTGGPRIFVRREDTGTEDLSPEEAARQPSLDDVAQLPKLAGAEQARRLATLLRERGKEGIGEDRFNKGMRQLREFTKANPDAFSENQGTDTDPRIDTSSLPTGIERIDKAGQTVVRGGRIPFEEDIPPIDELPADHPLRLRKQRADEGVDMTSGAGLSFGDRASIALTPDIGQLRANKITSVLGGVMQDTPDDLPKFRFDSALGEFQILRPTEDGKFRWTSLDGTGIELGDFADLLDLGEIGSMAGALVGTGKATKVFNFFKQGAARQAAQAGAGGFAGGTLGRMAGDAAGIIINFMQTGEAPTLEELVERGWSGAQIEAFASVTGELGGLILRGAARRIQGGNIRGADRVPDSEIDEANINIEQTREDLRTLRNAIGREDTAVTPGQASRSINVISDEADSLANASSKTKKAFVRQQAQNRRNLREYINREFSGDPQFLGDRAGTIVAANDALGTAGEVVVAQTDNGIIHFSPKIAPEDGLKLKPENEGWQIRGALLPDNVRGTGLGKQLYVAAKDEAERHGKVLLSDTDISQDAVDVWRSLDGEEGFGDLVWNKNITKVVDGEGRTWWKSTDGNPVVKMKEREAFTTKLLKSFRQRGRNELGHFTSETVPGEEFGRFIRRPGRKELGSVVEEMNKNPYIKQDVKEAILGDYQENVIKAGGKKFDPELWRKWKNSINNNLFEEVFSPEEMLLIRSKPNGLRTVVGASAKSTSDSRRILADSLTVDVNSSVFSDPTSRTLWNQVKSKSQNQRRRIMRLLDAQEMGQGVRELFKNELKQDLLQKTKAKNFVGYNKWLEQNREMISDILDSVPQQEARRAAAARGGQELSHIQKLEFIGRALERRGVVGEIRSTVAEANPTTLGLFRVVFGPLSRIQRFLTGARKGMVRSNSAKVADLITDPNQLSDLFRIKDFPLGSRITSRIVQDLGILPLLGIDEESFDADDAESREQLMRRVAEMLNAQEANSER